MNNQQIYKKLILQLQKKYKQNIKFIYFKQFYQYINFLNYKLILIKLINATMYLGIFKQILNKNLTSFFLGIRQNKIIFNLYYSLLILKQFIFFSFNLIINGGHFLISNNTFLIENILEYIYYLPQGFILGMPFGGILTNKKHILSKIKNTNYGFYNFPKISLETKEQILYCERMIYNEFFQKNYYNYYLLPNCLIIFDLNSYIFYEAIKLNIPILGLITNIHKLQTIVFPILFNNESIYSLFLFLMFLYEIFFFGLYLESYKYKITLFDFFIKKVKLKNNKKIIKYTNLKNVLYFNFYFNKFNILKKKRKYKYIQWKKNYIFNFKIYFNFYKHLKFFKYFIKKRLIMKYEKKKNFEFKKRRNFQTKYLLYYKYLDLFAYFFRNKFITKKKYYIVFKKNFNILKKIKYFRNYFKKIKI